MSGILQEDVGVLDESTAYSKSQAKVYPKMAL